MATRAPSPADPAVTDLFAHLPDFTPSAWKLTATGGVAIDDQSRSVCLVKQVKNRMLVRQLDGTTILAAELREESQTATEPRFFNAVASMLVWGFLFAFFGGGFLTRELDGSKSTPDKQLAADLRAALKESAAVHLGLVGAVVGAILGGRRATRQVNALNLVITTSELDLPCHIVRFLNRAAQEGSDEYAAALAQALNWRAIMMAISRPAAA